MSWKSCLVQCLLQPSDNGEEKGRTVKCEVCPGTKTKRMEASATTLRNGLQRYNLKLLKA